MSRSDYFTQVSDFFFEAGVCSREVANFIAAQSCLETDYGTSAIFLECHNAFGMKFPKKRMTTAVHERRNHSAYVQLYSSFLDYLLWLASFGFVKKDMYDVDRFTAKMRRSGFNPSASYVDTVLKIYKCYV